MEAVHVVASLLKRIALNGVPTVVILVDIILMDKEN